MPFLQPYADPRERLVRPEDGQLQCGLLQYWAPGVPLEMMLLTIQQILTEPLKDSCPADPCTLQPLFNTQTESRTKVEAIDSKPPPNPPSRKQTTKVQFDDYRQSWERLATTIPDRPRVELTRDVQSLDRSNNMTSSNNRIGLTVLPGKGPDGICVAARVPMEEAEFLSKRYDAVYLPCKCPLQETT
jgi:hypothetical protein